MEIRFHTKLKMNKPRMLIGLPGMGMVAKNTVTSFFELLKPEMFADIYEPHLSPSITFFENGLVVPVERDVSLFRFYYSKEKNIILFIGDMQFGFITKDNELIHFCIRKTFCQENDIGNTPCILFSHYNRVKNGWLNRHFRCLFAFRKVILVAAPNNN